MVHQNQTAFGYLILIRKYNSYTNFDTKQIKYNLNAHMKLELFKY